MSLHYIRVLCLIPIIIIYTTLGAKVSASAKVGNILRGYSGLVLPFGGQGATAADGRGHVAPCGREAIESLCISISRALRRELSGVTEPNCKMDHHNHRLWRWRHIVWRTVKHLVGPIYNEVLTRCTSTSEHTPGLFMAPEF